MDYKYLEQRFDAYNKDILSQRSEFFKDCQISDLSNLIHILQFETSSKSKNFRWGQRYFNSKKEDFSWLSSCDGKIKTSFYNRKTHESVCYDKQVYYSDDILKEHCLSHTKSKRKLGFYYKLSDDEKREVNETILNNLYMMDKKTYGLAQKPLSDVLWIDIDNHNEALFSDSNEAIRKLNKLVKLLNISLKDFIWIEANVFSGGIHAMLKLPFEANASYFADIEKEFNKEVSIECNFQSKLLRLPLSYEYLPLKRDDNILKKYNFTKDDFISTFNEAVNNINLEPVKSQFLIIDKKLKEKIAKKEKLNRLRQKYSDIKNHYWNTEQKLFIREKETKTFEVKELYKLQCGTRFETFKKLVPYLKYSGKTFEEVCDALIELQEDSKDMNHFERLIPDLRKFYNKIKNVTISNTGIYQKYISNQTFLSDITIKFFENEDFKRFITEKFIRNYVKVRNYKNNDVSDEKKEILYKQIPYYIKELLGKMYYDINNPKRFKNEKLNHFIGFQLSYKELDLIQEQSIKDLKLKESPLNRTSLQYLKKALLMTLDIEEITNNSKRNWIKGSCKSYRIRTYNDIENVLKHFYNSCFREIVLNKFIIKNNNIYILYILLIENYEIIDYDDVMFIKNHIPIGIDT